MPKVFYDPADPNSSPFDPAMGDIVLYRVFKTGFQKPESFPAIVVATHPDDKCDLVVFTTTGIRHVMAVRFSSDDEAGNTWYWMPEKEPREVKPAKQEIKTGKPVAVK